METLETIWESFINGNRTWACDEVRKLDDHDLIQILDVWANSKPID